VLLNHGDGTFASRHDYVSENGTTYGTDYVAVADVDGDGKPDLEVLNGFEAAHGLTVYVGNGDGTFGSPRNYDLAGDAEAIVAADLNGDGKIDLPSLDLGGIVEIVNAGGGNLEQTYSYDAGGEGSSIFAGELTGGQNADLVVTYPDAGTVQVFLNEGDGALRPYTAYVAPGESVAIGDLNGDGTQDLAVAGKTVSILRNRGNGVFTARRQYTMGPKPPHAVAIGDLNGDGKPDLVTANGTTVVVRLAR
jgi:FG-GAP-like repeat